jgi:hypothetical protein
MINLKELTFINEAIKHLGYKTSKYIKLDPYIHLNWIYNTIYTLFLISLQNQAFTFNEFYGLTSLQSNMWCYEFQCNENLIIKKLNNSYKIAKI